MVCWCWLSTAKQPAAEEVTAASAFADMQNEDKRNAMEVVMEQKAGKKQFEQESEDKEKLES